MIELKNVSKYYTANGITNLGLRNISLTFNKNEIVAITGDSGSGKSTLLNVITKIDTFDEGEIYYKGNETSYFSISDMDDFRKNKVGFIFQNYNIIDAYTVLENVMLPLLLVGKSKKEAKHKAIELIEKVGLKGKENNRGSKLSGGEKQRCVIARALASDCEILACDEPTGNLDSKTGKEIIELIKNVACNKLVLIVTHDYNSVSDIATRKLRISDGEVVEDVSFKTLPKDLDEPLDLDYKPLSKKVDLVVARNNILFTPKKTIFLATIFFVISIAVLFLFQLINSSQRDVTVVNSYKNRQENRLYVYNKGHKEIDIDLLKSVSDDYVLNSFYEEMYIHINSDTYMPSNFYFYNKYVNDIDNIKGRFPNDDSEIYIVLSDDSYSEYYENALNKEVVLDYFGVYKIVGYGHSNSVNANVITKNDKLEKLIFESYLSLELYVSNQITYFEIEKSDELSLVLPNKYKNKPYEIKMNTLYTVTDYRVEYADIDKPILRYNQDLFKKDNVFEASVYTSKPTNLKKKLEALGFTVDYPKKLDDGLTLDVFLANLESYGLMILASMMLIIVFFITYFILAKVYISKKKDYEILRTLGVTKKDMKHIVSYEVLGIGLSCLVLAYIIGITLIYNVPKLAYLKGITFTTSLIYFVVLFLFIYAVGYRFNKILFKFSVSKSLKGDEFFD